MKRTLLRSLILVISLVVFPFIIPVLAQTTFTSTNVGLSNWNTALSWTQTGTVDGDGVPDAGDNVIIQNGHTVNVNVGSACSAMTINGNGIVNFSANVTLAVGGVLTMNGASQITGGNALQVLNAASTFSVPAGATNARISGITLSVTGSSTITGVFSIISATGTKTFTGDVILSVGSTWSETAAATISYGGSLTNNASTFSTSSGTHTFTGTTKVFSGTANTSIPNVVINGSYTNSGTLTVSTALSGGGSLTNNGTINISGGGAGACSITTLGNVGTINLSAAGTTTTALANFTNSAILNITGSGTIAGITNNASGIVTHSGSSTITSFNNATATSTLNISTTPTVPTFGTLTVSTAGNTVNYTGAGAQAVRTANYSNLGLSGSGNKTFGALVNVVANLSISGTAVGDLGTFTHTANSLTLGGTGQVNGFHGSTGSIATTKNDTYFLNTSTGRVNVASCTAPSTGTATTYYSRNATLGGQWNDNTSWTTIADGTGGPLAAGVWPRRYDNVVIRSGHTITVDAITDNNACGISPDGLGNANIGAGGGTGFNGSNVAMFYQTGDVTISGTLTVISGTNMMVAGYTHITSTGTFSLSSYLVNAGYLEADASSTLTTLDDLSLTGNSTTIINSTATSADDLNIDHTLATLCGTGTQALLNSGGSAINFTNPATTRLNQICTNFTVTCSGGGCSGFPVVGTTSVILGITGPGGVGNSTNNKLWLRANDLNLANGAGVASWNDISGNSLTATNATVAERPTFATNSANGFPSLLFSPTVTTAHNLSLGAPAGLNFVPGTNSWSFIIVYRSPANGLNTPNQGALFSKSWNTTGRSYQYQVDDISGTSSAFASQIGNVLSGGTVQINTNNFVVSSHTNNASAKTSFSNESANFTNVAITPGSDPLSEVLIGARRDTGPANGTEGFPYTGNIAEIMMYNSEVNAAQRIIITDYLAAKYAITLAANDFYSMDDVGNGNFDYEVAGIGQATDGSNHKDAKTGIVRMWNPNGLANGEFLLWGHNNVALTSNTTVVGLGGVDGTIIKERLLRVWRVDETGDVGTVSVSFDIGGFSNPLGSNMRLLIDRDGDGFGDNDVAPVSGSFSNNTVVFSGINFVDGDRFTLGNSDLARPLPIQLINFKALAKSSSVELTWQTATEKNNDFFTVQKSSDPEKGFQEVGILKGNGNSNAKQEYFMEDPFPYQGLSYYRLKQTDFDGQYTYSKLVPVNYEGSSLASFSVYPNPLKTKQAVIVEIVGLKGMTEVPVVVYNSMGQKILEKTIAIDQSGMATKELLFEKPLSSGVFIVKAGPTLQLTQRLVVE